MKLFDVDAFDGDHLPAFLLLVFLAAFVICGILLTLESL